MKLPWWVGLVIGAVVFFGSGNLLWGVGAGGLAGLAMLWWTREQTRHDDSLPPESRAAPPQRTTRSTPIEVVCKTVTPLRQEWVSNRTGRLYDVLSANGPADAKPGDRGRVVLTPTGWRIEPARTEGRRGRGVS